MEAGVRPITHACDQAVLDRIEVQIVHLTAPIRFITNQVFPKPRLPDIRFVSVVASHDLATLTQRAHKGLLEHAHPRGKISIARWQLHQQMQMFRQHHRSR